MKRNNLKALSQLLEPIIKRNNIQFLAVFGSFSKGTQTAKSDLDLLVRFSDEKSLLDLVRIENEFSNTVNKPVDLVTEQSISPYIRETVFSTMTVIYGNA